ncbi:MAG TPA: hypothetical protein VEY93_00925 [Longimicrobium sp.]|nr:hypothetical protein [Longimicrobium sp.]
MFQQDAFLTPYAGLVYDTHFSVNDAKGNGNGNYYGQVQIANCCQSAVITLSSPTSPAPYQMAVGSQLPMMIYPGQYLWLQYYVEGGTTIQSGDSAMHIPITIKSLYNQSCNVPSAGGPEAITGTLNFWCDAQYTQGDIHIGLDMGGDCPIIDSASAHQPLTGMNNFDDMTLWIGPAGRNVTPGYNPTDSAWYEPIWGYGLSAWNIAQMVNTGAGYLGAAFTVLKIAARLGFINR